MKPALIMLCCVLFAAFGFSQNTDIGADSVLKNTDNKKKSTVTPLPECCSSAKNIEDSTQSETSKFIFSGSGFTNIIVGNKFDSAGFEAGFMPVFLYRPSKQLYFILHLHLSAGGGHLHSNQSTTATSSGGHHGGTVASTSTSSTTNSDASIMLYYANLNYYFSPYLSITGGMIPSPFGIYPDRLHLAWQNKLPDAPLGMGHADMAIPLVEFGFMANGEIPLWKLKIKYAAIVSNGPSLAESGSDAGKLSYSNLVDNNKNKSVGGRIGLLPFPNSSFEIGMFGQWAEVGIDTTLYTGVDAYFFGSDVSYTNYFNFLKGTIDIKGQYNSVLIDKAYYPADPILTVSVPQEDVNLDDSTYRFNNQRQLFFITATYRPTASSSWTKNTEFVLRYDMLRDPCFALWNADNTRCTAGIIYWIEKRSAVKLSYQVNLSPKPIGKERIIKNLLMMQWVIGL